MREIAKRPVAGDQYHSLQYPDYDCKVISVYDDHLLFQWLGTYAGVDEQTATIKDFVRDFRFVPAKRKAQTDKDQPRET